MDEKWEYKFFSASITSASEASMNTFVNSLNELGAAGWEAVGQLTTSTPGSGMGHLPVPTNRLLLKRRLES